jgi:hypothetical protein
MGFFDFLKGKTKKAEPARTPAPEPVPVPKHEADALLETMMHECAKAPANSYAFSNYGPRLVKRYLMEDQSLRKRTLLHFAKVLPELKQSRNTTNQQKQQIIRAVFLAVFEMLKEFTDEELHIIFDGWRKATIKDHFWEFPSEKVAKILQEKIKTHGLSEPIRKSFELAKVPKEYYFDVSRRRLNDKIDLILQGKQSLPIHKGDVFGTTVLEFLDAIENEDHKTKWEQLLEHCLSVGSKGSPSQKWLNTAKQLVHDIGEDAFAAKMIEWLLQVKQMIIEIHKSKEYQVDFLREANHDMLKGLIWCSAFANNNELVSVLDNYAMVAYRKKPGVGPISSKTGTACMHAFAQLPFSQGIAKLMKFRMKIKNNNLIKSVDKIIADLAEKNNVSNDQIEELSTPDFGLDQEAVLRKKMGDFVAVYTIKSMHEAELTWEKDGKVQKGVPTQVKNEYAAELKAFKNQIKEIESYLPALKEKIESFYLRQKTLPYNRWKESYLDHRLTGILAKKLIWHFSANETKTQAIWLNGQLTDVTGAPINVPDDTEVQLWHPIGFSTDTIIAWRNFLQQHSITQPFKQAYREIYIVTDAELNTDTYSNRFAAHIIRQHQMSALAKQRGWHYQLMGAWDGHNIPYITLKEWDMRAQFFVESDWQGDTSPAGIFTYVSTDQVRFYRGNDQIRMVNVPAMVFTEIMRDVDLFVGVCSIGNDPNWQNTGNERMDGYWRDYSFGDLSESAKVRQDVLKTLIPRLKIGNRCSFDGKYLLVKGNIRKYKIHMGSGNILMEPNDEYLCIVPDRSEKPGEKVFLPFEGDNMLSIILSKALLLADDQKITDPTITRQLKR